MEPTALITGAANRIGRAIALHLAEQGYDIALHYHTSQKAAEETRCRIISMGRHCELFQADLSQEQEVIALARDVFASFHLDILINNASIFIPSEIFSEMDTARDMFNVNFWAPFILVKKFAKSFDRGLIVNLLDSDISKRKTCHFDYLLTKKMLSDLTEMSAYHLAPGIRVNGIAPGTVLAPAAEDQDYLRKMGQDVPLRRPGSLSEICSTLAYFIENEFVTGQVIYVDGGKHLGRASQSSYSRTDLTS